MQVKKVYDISDFVNSVLKNAFPNNRFKQQLNEDEDKLNFACPYCGDSENDVSKKRGNIFIKTGTYKCFNDGCLTFTKLNKFISHWAQKYQLPIPNMIDVTFPLAGTIHDADIHAAAGVIIVVGVGRVFFDRIHAG